MTVYTAFKDPAVVRALSHPLRTRILNELYEGRASPTELADKFDAPSPTSPTTCACCSTSS